MRKFLSLCLLGIASFLSAQGLLVQSVSPTNQRNDVEADARLEISFDQVVNPATVTPENFKVFGRWSGPAEVQIEIDEDGQRVSLSPLEPMMHGEWVTVTLTKNIQALDGTPMAHSYVWNYWVKTNAYALSTYASIDTIALRAPGEGNLQSYGAYAGDLNNDGFSDLTVVNETTDDLRILLNDGNGGYSGDYETIELNSGTPSPNEGADFNNDGEIDFAVCTAHSDQMRVLFGNGNGQLTDMDNYTTGSNARGLGVIELNGDGHDDIVIANREGNNLTLFLNDGTGQFSSSTIDTPGTGESGLVVTDFNNDGIQDLILGMFYSQEITVMLGDEEQGFSASTPVGVLGRPWMLASGDLNGDGFADVVSANSTGHNVAVLLNDGNGGLLEPTYLTQNQSRFPLAIDVGDLDGDGDLDVVTSYYTSSNFLVYLNNGDGVFELFQSLEATTNGSCAILHDRDNNGFLDITGVDEGDDLVFLYEGVGNISSLNGPNIELIQGVYPNPFKDQIRLETITNCADCVLTIYDELGSVIKTIAVDYGDQLIWDGTTISGSSTPAGVYVLRLEKDGEIATIRVIKQ